MQRTIRFTTVLLVSLVLGACAGGSPPISGDDPGGRALYRDSVIRYVDKTRHWDVNDYGLISYGVVDGNFIYGVFCKHPPGPPMPEGAVGGDGCSFMVYMTLKSRKVIRENWME